MWTWTHTHTHRVGKRGQEQGRARQRKACRVCVCVATVLGAYALLIYFYNDLHIKIIPKYNWFRTKKLIKLWKLWKSFPQNSKINSIGIFLIFPNFSVSIWSDVWWQKCIFSLKKFKFLFGITERNKAKEKKRFCWVSSWWRKRVRRATHRDAIDSLCGMHKRQMDFVRFELFAAYQVRMNRMHSENYARNVLLLLIHISISSQYVQRSIRLRQQPGLSSTPKTQISCHFVRSDRNESNGNWTTKTEFKLECRKRMISVFFKCKNWTKLCRLDNPSDDSCDGRIEHDSSAANKLCVASINKQKTTQQTTCVPCVLYF